MIKMTQTKLLSKLFAVALLLGVVQNADAQRKEIILRDGWRFTRAEKLTGTDAVHPCRTLQRRKSMAPVSIRVVIILATSAIRRYW